MKHQEILTQLGLTEKEAKLYLTLLEIGPNPASSVSRKAGITRTTAYAALETLKEKGLLSLVEQGGIQQFSAVDPKKLEEYAKHQQEKASQNLENISKLVPSLQSLTGDLVLAPKVKYFEGINGIKTIYNDITATLKDLKSKGRVKLVFSSSPNISTELRKVLDSAKEDRKKYKISARFIVPNSPQTKKRLARADEFLSDLRLMPKDIEMDFDSEVNIYKDKIAIMSLNNERPHGIIIESNNIAATQRTLFEIIWRACKRGEGL